MSFGLRGLLIGSDEDQKGQSKFGSSVRGPDFLLDFLSRSRKSRSSEELVSHGWLFEVCLSEKGLNLMN